LKSKGRFIKKKNTIRQGLLLTLLGISFIAPPSNKVLAAGTVTICDEAHLRSALAGGGLVTCACDGTITLTNTLDVTNLTTIDATGHSVTLSGGDALRILSINPGVTASLINLTLANGFQGGPNGVLANGQPSQGAAIFNNSGTVALTGCTVVSNKVVGGAGPSGGAGGSGAGAAIWNQGGNVLVTNCYFAANGATGGAGSAGSSPGPGADSAGGAVGSQGGTVILQSSVFSKNKTQGGPPGLGFSAPIQAGNAYGGTLWASNATVGCYASTFANNLAVGADMFLGPSPVGGKAGSASGGALFVTNGTVNCIGCIFSTNAVYSGLQTLDGIEGTAQGGAIWSGSSSVVAQCSFVGNQTVGNGSGSPFPWSAAGEGSGGAIFNNSLLSLSASFLAGNIALGGVGGVVSHTQCYGGIGRGGAIFNLGSLNLTNCTLVANSASGGNAGKLGFGFGAADGGAGTGGGLCNSNGVANLVNLTFASNNVTGGIGVLGGLNGLTLGGAIYNTNGTVNLYNIIVFASTPSGSNCFGTLVDRGYNLSSDSSAGFFAAGSLNSTDPILGPLDDYGGPTLTMVLLAGSPAINGGNPATFPPTDQRGHARPFGPAPDIGAFESSPPYTVRGFVSGSTLKDEVLVVAGLTTTSTTNHGSYRVDGLSANTWSVSPQSADYLFVPTNRSVTVGPDQISVNFKAYHWNALSLDDVTNQVMHVIFAPSNSPTFRVFVSPNLVQWSPFSTNAVGPGNYTELFIPIGNEPAQFFRAAIP
jgi:fibronectin-binding autotransporter adhesin